MREFVEQVIMEAGNIALEYFEKELTSRSKSMLLDIVTEADEKVEKYIFDKVMEKYPDHGFIGEEFGSVQNDNNPKYTWVVDPIDGTYCFKHHLPMWCTMIGIEKNGEPYIGAIFNPINNELFFAEKGRGAYLNGEKITVDGRTEIGDMICHFGGNFQSVAGEEMHRKYRLFYDNLLNLNKRVSIRNWGSCGLGLTALACGRIHLQVMAHNEYHDILPGFIIATEAGVKFTDNLGNDWKKGVRDFVAANSGLHKNLMKLF